ncbi:hypothetical protein [Paenibacillus sp. V4I7]|uniref:hypothetical protein n=1 Tax=Paenibacillus sp. V4I7 TaxID=3042307 RepID=UPI00277F72BE|nr:hypothetical protein [Paenibacillus sp. V4I7]MDQ0897630.1 hypothetical protein [Paenibacillus sp. V4I7]
MTIKSQITAQARKEGEHGSTSKSDPARRGSSSEQTLLTGSVQRQSAFGGSGITPSASQVLQLQRTIGNQATAKLLTSRMDARTVVQRTPAIIQRKDTLPDPVKDVQVNPLLNLIQSQRQQISDLQRSKEVSSDDQEALEQCFKKLTTLYIQMGQTDNPMALWESFIIWTENSAWSGGGSEYWEAFTRLANASDAKKEKEKDEEKKGGAKSWSPECDAVFDDMNDQYGRWNGKLKTRGAWWGSAQPGSTTGAKNVPSEVIKELKKRVGGTGWRFSDSFSGGISFHKTRGGVDFIYHMLPPN